MADQPGGPPSYPAQQPVGSQQPVAPQEPAGYFMGRKLGGWGARVGAYLLDLIFVSVPTVILVAIAVIPWRSATATAGSPARRS